MHWRHPAWPGTNTRQFRIHRKRHRQARQKLLDSECYKVASRHSQHLRDIQPSVLTCLLLVSALSLSE